MEVVYPRCAGLDVHASSITACVRIATGHEVTYQHRTVATTTAGLLDMAEWLGAAGLHACGDGGHRRVLEAGVARPRRAVHARARERDAHSERAWSKERRQRRDLDRGLAGRMA